MFGEDCIASYLIIGCWSQVSWGVLKSINGLSPGGRNPGKDVDIFGNARSVHRDPNRGRWYFW